MTSEKEVRPVVVHVDEVTVRLWTATTCTDLGANTGLRGDRQATNHLSYALIQPGSYLFILLVTKPHGQSVRQSAGYLGTYRQ
jgi:hypothetical protein